DLLPKIDRLDHQARLYTAAFTETLDELRIIEGPLPPETDPAWQRRLPKQARWMESTIEDGEAGAFTASELVPESLERFLFRSPVELCHPFFGDTFLYMGFQPYSLAATPYGVLFGDAMNPGLFKVDASGVSLVTDLSGFKPWAIYSAPNGELFLGGRT